MKSNNLTKKYQHSLEELLPPWHWIGRSLILGKSSLKAYAQIYFAYGFIGTVPSPIIGRQWNIREANTKNFL